VQAMRSWMAALAAVVILSAGFSLSAAAEAEKPAPKKSVRVVEIVLRGEVEEQREMDSPFAPGRALLRDFTGSIRKAAKDDAVKAILLRLEMPTLGLARVQELIDALAEFKAAKKKVYCYLPACGNGDYLVACQADKVCAPPGAMLMLTGLVGEATFIKGLLDWAGIQADMLHFGKHKSAADTLTRDSMSDENRQVLNELLDDLYGQFVGIIAKGRGLPEAKVRETIDLGPFSANQARTFRVIDDVAYFDQFLDAMGKELGGKVDLVKDYHSLGSKTPDLSELNIFTLFASLKPKPDIPVNDKPKVVVLFASGMILWAKPAFGLGGVITASEMHKLFEKIRDDATVKAVVLRIDSPGGSALVSDLIWREVALTRKAGKQVVASMGNVAASGGYYIAMGADAVVAQPGTITGSIGVVGGKLVLRGLYDKIGVKCEILTRGKNAAVFSDYAPFSDTERERVKALMGEVYNDFVHKAAEGRQMADDKMRELATGRVWTGRAAKEVGLVDALGGLKEAYELAVERAGLKGKDAQPVILPREKNFFEALLGSLGEAFQPRLPGLPLRERVLPCAQVLEALRRENVLTLMPYFIEVR